MRFAALLCLLWSATVGSAETLVYFGTYTEGTASEGIYVSTMDPATGVLSKPRLAAKAPNPSFVAISNDGKTLYAVAETSADVERPVGVIAFQINEDGTLNKLNERPTGGGAACHVSISPSGRMIGVANYSGGSCVSFPINEDGSLGETASFHQHVGSSVDPRRQGEPHAHSINFSVDGSQAFVADLGIDQILVYDVEPQSSKLVPADPSGLKLPAGGGPRHFCFLPAGDAALANLEMTSQVALLRYDTAKKSLAMSGIASTLPAGAIATGNSTAECLVHPNGRFGYVSNRGHNTIAVFAIEVKAGALKLLENESSGGEIPRGFGIDPSGSFLVVANQKTGNVISLRIDPQTGMLTATGSEIQIGTPVNVRFLQR